MGILVEQIAVHLEFYGYKIEKREPKEAGRQPLYLASHEDRPNMRFYELAPYFVLIGSGFRSPRGPSPEIGDLLNEVNDRMSVSRAYWKPLEPGPGVIVNFESVYMGVYKKDLFAAFYDMMRKDVHVMHDIADCSKIFSAEAA